MMTTERLAPTHPFLPVDGHPYDGECTHQADGTDATYCGRPKVEHERDCNRCGAGALYIVRCWKGCEHAQCAAAEHQSRSETKGGTS